METTKEEVRQRPAPSYDPNRKGDKFRNCETSQDFMRAFNVWHYVFGGREQSD